MDITRNGHFYRGAISGSSEYDWNTAINAFSGGSHIGTFYIDGQKNSSGLSAFDRTGAPTGAYRWGILIIFRASNADASTLEVYVPDVAYPSNSNQSIVYYRTMYNDHKNTWNYIKVDGFVNAHS